MIHVRISGELPASQKELKIRGGKKRNNLIQMFPAQKLINESSPGVAI